MGNKASTVSSGATPQEINKFDELKISDIDSDEDFTKVWKAGEHRDSSKHSLSYRECNSLNVYVNKNQKRLKTEHLTPVLIGSLLHAKGQTTNA